MGETKVSVGEALRRSCRLARDYHEKNKSPHALFVESGYAHHRRAIDHEMIKEHVRSNPELIGDWFVYSDNKRVSQGWYFHLESIDGPYKIGYYPSRLFKNPETTYSDGAEACAIFIKHELESFS